MFQKFATILVFLAYFGWCSSIENSDDNFKEWIMNKRKQPITFSQQGAITEPSYGSSQYEDDTTYEIITDENILRAVELYDLPDGIYANLPSLTEIPEDDSFVRDRRNARRRGYVVVVRVRPRRRRVYYVVRRRCC